MKEFLRKLLKVEPEIIEKEVFVPKEVRVEVLPAKLEEILDGLQETLSSRATVLQLCREDATEWHRGKIQGQIEMLSKVMIEFAGRDDGEES